MVYAESGAEVERLRAKVAELEEELSKRPRDPSSYPVPTSVEFCGDRIDLSKTDIKRRFESEIIKIVKNRFQVQLYINRATSVFPVIEEIAEELDTCPDLKFLAVVESALKPRAVSRAKATGWWQFMPVTAKGFKLQMYSTIDERSDLRASTRAALTYLKRLYKRFGSWPLAMAGYNTGPGRLRRSSKAQKRGSFWELDLYTEAERYSPRVLAMYHVLTHLKEYDFGKTLEDGWPQEPLEGFTLMLPTREFRTVTIKQVEIKETKKRRGKKRRGKKRRGKKRRVKTKKERVVTTSAKLKLTAIALKLGLPVRDLRRLNPHLIGEKLPLGIRFNLYLPPGKLVLLKKTLGPKAKVELTYRNEAARMPPRKPTPSPKSKQAVDMPDDLVGQLGGPLRGEYRVKEGDRLWEIAVRAGVTIDHLITHNGLGPLSILQVGQTLRLDIQ